METKPPKPRVQIPPLQKRPTTASFSHSDSYREESPHSPLRYLSPFRSDQADPVSTYSSPLTTPPSSAAPPTASADPSLSMAVVVREEDPSARKVRPAPPTSPVVRSWSREDSFRVWELGLRISEMGFGLVSFSVMAADKTQGWAGDSFDRYKEYRYCLAVNVIAFVYSLLQAYDLGYRMAFGKHMIRHHLRRHFNFLIDQILAYLLISASSSAAARVNDWQSNWGRDKFTEMATGSITVSFLAFLAFAASSVISGYNLCTYDAT